MGRKTAGILVGAALAIAVLPVGGAPREKIERKVGADLVELDYSDVSPPLRSIKPIPPRFADNEEHEVKRLPHHHPFRPLGRRPGDQEIVGQSTGAAAQHGVARPEDSSQFGDKIVMPRLRTAKRL